MNIPLPRTWDSTWASIKDVNIDYKTKVIFENLSKEVDIKDKSICELGCGTGRLSFLALNQGAKDVTLVDFSDEALNLAKNLFDKCSNVQFIKSDILNLQLSKKHDIVFSSGLVEHFEGDSLIKCVDAHKRFSKDLVAIIVPASHHYNNIRCRQNKNKSLYGWWKPLSKSQLKRLFEQLGIELLINRRFYTLYGIQVIGHGKFSTILRPVDRWLGGLLLTIGKCG